MIGESVDAAEEVIEAGTRETVEDVETLLFRDEPPGLPHDGEVFRNGGEITANFGLKVRDTGGTAGEDFRDLKPGGVGEGFDHLDPVIEERAHYLAILPNSGVLSRS